MLKLKITTILIFFFASLTFAQKADYIIGKYHLPNNLDIRIYKTKSGKYFGKVIALNGFEDGQTKDIKNSDKSKRNDLLIGKVIIKNLEYDTDEKEWTNGTIYGIEKGLTLNFEITKVGEKEITVVASKLVFWKTLVWKRIL